MLDRMIALFESEEIESCTSLQAHVDGVIMLGSCAHALHGHD